jgi:periplasmic divalent cation tolerance protein
MDQTLMVLVNVPDHATAHHLARTLVEGRFAACVNILPEVRSVYRWQGAVEEASEVTMFIKTTHARYADLEATVKALHPYEVPELIALPIVAGLPDYLAWIATETKKEVDV